MLIFIKLIQAILLGAVMLFSVMLILTALYFFVGMIAELLGFKSLAAGMYTLQETMWIRTKRWFFRYKEPKDSGEGK